MADADHTTKSGAEWTARKSRRDRERREAVLDKAMADRNRFQQEHPGKDADLIVDVIDYIIGRIFAEPIRTLGDARLHAKARLERWQDELNEHERTAARGAGGAA